MPDLSDTPANQEFRSFFYSKWGKETCIISARSCRAEYPCYRQRLSIKAAWGGAESYHLDNRTVAVDDDNYLVINDGHAYGSVLASVQPVHSFSIFFRPGFVEGSLGALMTSMECALDRGPEHAERPVEFAEHLQPHDRVVSPLLRYIALQVDSGVDDECWYGEQLDFLAERMLQVHCAGSLPTESLTAIPNITRREILRRISRGTDFIHTCYMRPIGITEVAKAASLSRFHFIRMFRAVHGLTPYAYIQRKRALVARRLLETTKLGQKEVAARVGFEGVSTLLRQLRWLANPSHATPRRSTRPT